MANKLSTRSTAPLKVVPLEWNLPSTTSPLAGAAAEPKTKPKPKPKPKPRTKTKPKPKPKSDSFAASSSPGPKSVKKLTMSEIMDKHEALLPKDEGIRGRWLSRCEAEARSWEEVMDLYGK